MRINEVKNKEVEVTLSADELVMIGNVMYFYERFYQQDPNEGKPAAKFHEFNAQVLVASNLCQYGHLDNFALEHIVEHQHKANPDSGLVARINGKTYPAIDLSQFYPKNASQMEGQNE